MITFGLHYLVYFMKYINVIFVMYGIFGANFINTKKKHCFFRYMAGMLLLALVLILDAMYPLSERTACIDVCYMVASFWIVDLKKLECLKTYILSRLFVEIWETIIFYVISILFSVDIMNLYETPLTDSILTGIALALWLILVKALRMHPKKEEMKLGKFFLSFVVELMILFQLTFVIYVLMDGIRNNVRAENTYVLIVMLASSVSMSFYFLYILKLEETKKLQKMRLHAYQREQQLTKDYYIKLHEKNEQTRARQHDTRHMLNMLRTHITTQNWKNALDVIDKWTEKNVQYRKIVYSKNQVIDAVIDGVLGAELAKETLCLQLKGKILKEIKIDDLDLCLMLSNLLENAKEAVLQLELNKRNIDLKIDIREDFAVFDIKNPYDADGKIEKKEEGWHGYGLKNVEEIVKKYNGKLNITTEATMFCVSVILENVCK